jgi:hypothetical protein
MILLFASSEGRVQSASLIIKQPLQLAGFQ